MALGKTYFRGSFLVEAVYPASQTIKYDHKDSYSRIQMVASVLRKHAPSSVSTHQLHFESSTDSWSCKFGEFPWWLQNHAQLQLYMNASLITYKVNNYIPQSNKWIKTSEY